MKKIVFLLVCLFHTFFVSAQYIGLVLELNKKTFVFGDKVNVRETPNKDGKVLAQLTAGEVVTVLDTAANQQMVQNGRKDYWYKIRFGGNKTGFLWGGLLSYGGDTLVQKDIKFAYNFTEVKKRKNEDSKDVTVELRAIRGGQVIAKTNYIIPNMTEENQSYSGIDVTGGGLKGVNALLHIHIGYPACGYTQHETVSLWDGTKFTTLPTLEASSDAGAYGYAESYIFPSNMELGGMEDKIIYEVVQYQTLENGEEGESNEFKIRRILKRKGQQYVKPKTPDVKF